jgi:hypothetical protein
MGGTHQDFRAVELQGTESDRIVAAYRDHMGRRSQSYFAALPDLPDHPRLPCRADGARLAAERVLNKNRATGGSGGGAFGFEPTPDAFWCWRRRRLLAHIFIPLSFAAVGFIEDSPGNHCP